MTLDLAFDEFGSDGPPVLILHGLYGSGTNWRSLARRLAASAQVFTVDLRNHGRSPWADTMAYAEMAADVVRLIDAQGLQHPAIMGHSMGGKVAMALALTQPQKVGRLVVVDIAPVSYPDRMSTYAQAMQQVDLAHAATRSAIRNTLVGPVGDTSVTAFLMQNLVDHDGRFDWRVNLAAILREIPVITGFPPELQALRFDGPCSAIAGAGSSYIAPPNASVFAPMFPGMQVQVIEGAGHWVHADQPEAFFSAALAALGLPAPAA
jgi:esterase